MIQHISVQEVAPPIELRLKKADKLLEIDFADGKCFRLPAEFLRVESPSAEVQGHSPGQKRILSGRKHVGIIDIEPVGNYAIRIRFDDLHETDNFSKMHLKTNSSMTKTVDNNIIKTILRFL